MHGATRPDQCKDAKHGEADPLGRGADAGTRYVHPRMRMLVHISHVSRPHTDVNPRPQWPRPHVATPLFRHTTHACRSPMGSSTENLVAAVACRHPIILAHFSHVSRTHGEHHRRPPSGHGRLGAPPKVQVAAVSSTTEPQWPLSHGATS